MLLITVVLCCLSTATWGSQIRSFPPGFKFGAATAAYQVEGGWNADDKTESIWDVHTHRHPELFADHSTGDVASDCYNQWERDIEIAAELGLDFYRFSIAWPRIMPTSFSNNISEAGTKYYNNLINGLLDRGIEPLITIYHWELPERLQKLGGWTNPLIADWFADYARVLFSLFGDRVKTWITINEPMIICDITYNLGTYAPPILDPGVADLICAKNVLMAHAKAYKIYDEEFRAKYQGEVGFNNHFTWLEPASKEDDELTKTLLQVMTGKYFYPILSKEGGWPPVVEKSYAEISKKEGYPRSRFPTLTEEEKKLIRGSCDFLAVNHYTSRIVREAELGEEVGFWPLDGASDFNAHLNVKPDWPASGSDLLAIYPEGIRYLLAWIKKEYGDVKVLIAENGYASKSRTLDDVERVNFFKATLEQVLLAIKEDGVNVVGYTAWSLMDSFEWLDGYTTKFGLFDVDFTDPARPRTARSSARYYANVIQRRSLDITAQDSF